VLLALSILQPASVRSKRSVLQPSRRRRKLRRRPRRSDDLPRRRQRRRLLRRLPQKKLQRKQPRTHRRKLLRKPLRKLQRRLPKMQRPKSQRSQRTLLQRQLLHQQLLLLRMESRRYPFAHVSPVSPVNRVVLVVNPAAMISRNPRHGLLRVATGGQHLLSSVVDLAVEVLPVLPVGVVFPAAPAMMVAGRRVLTVLPQPRLLRLPLVTPRTRKPMRMVGPLSQLPPRADVVAAQSSLRCTLTHRSPLTRI
jgi:hypothetical protein